MKPENKFKTAEIDVIEFRISDVITLSGNGTNPENDDIETGKSVDLPFVPRH